MVVIVAEVCLFWFFGAAPIMDKHTSATVATIAHTNVFRLFLALKSPSVCAPLSMYMRARVCVR